MNVHRLTFQSVSYRYRRRAPKVLSSLDWQVPPGRTVLLGANGAGKTTLLSLGANALEPAEGAVLLGSIDPSRRRDRVAFRRAIGWMPQQTRAVSGLTVREQVAYAGWLKGLPTRVAWDRAAEVLDAVDLTSAAAQRATELSGGQLRRVGLAQALVHDADVLLLDEPTAGLDPEQRARFRERLREVSGRRTVVVSTHQVDDLTELYDTVVVLEHGRIRFEGPLDAFMSLAPRGSAHPGEAAYSQALSHHP